MVEIKIELAVKNVLFILFQEKRLLERFFRISAPQEISYPPVVV